MQHSSAIEQYRKEPSDFLRVSHDGYVRMTRHVFLRLPLVHYLSGLDEDHLHPLVHGGVESTISGYTEWISSSVPVVSVGWDWRLNLLTGVPRYEREGGARSNIMIIDAENGRDVGDDATAETIAYRLDRSGWEEDIRRQIALRYA